LQPILEKCFPTHQVIRLDDGALLGVSEQPSSKSRIRGADHLICLQRYRAGGSGNYEKPGGARPSQ
jgi:hypothetical protein